jgi:hypothetical protein
MLCCSKAVSNSLSSRSVAELPVCSTTDIASAIQIVCRRWYRSDSTTRSSSKSTASDTGTGCRGRKWFRVPSSCGSAVGSSKRLSAVSIAATTSIRSLRTSSAQCSERRCGRSSAWRDRAVLVSEARQAPPGTRIDAPGYVWTARYGDGRPTDVDGTRSNPARSSSGRKQGSSVSPPSISITWPPFPEPGSVRTWVRSHPRHCAPYERRCCLRLGSTTHARVEGGSPRVTARAGLVLDTRTGCRGTGSPHRTRAFHFTRPTPRG